MGRRRLVEALTLVAAPGAAFFLVPFKPIVQNTALDPYVYTGYIHNFTDLIERYGLTYYSVRFGMIVPSQFLTGIFGPIAGYFVFRYLLALLAGLPFYVLVRQHLGRTTAAASFVLLMTSPWFATTLLWDYTDAAGVPFLFAAICLFSIEHQRRGLLDFCAGLCAGMAIHSNVFAVAPLGIYVGVYSVCWVAFGRGPSAIVRRVLVSAAAVGVVTAAGVLYYWWRVDQPNIFAITFQTSSELLGGELANWRTPGTGWIAERWWALTPPVLVGLATVTWTRRARRNFRCFVVWASAIVTTAFYYAYQFLLNGTFLQLSYYFSYALPVMFLLLASALAALWEHKSDHVQWASVLAVVAAAAGPWVLWSFDLTFVRPATLTQHMAIVAAAFAAVVLARWLRRADATIVASALVGLALFSCFAAEPYVSTIDSRRRPDHLEMDVYRTALQFMDVVPRLAQRPGGIRFWYWYDGASSSIDSIQSTYLWGYSRLRDGNMGMPYLGTAEIDMIRSRGVHWLALLATDNEQLASGRAALVEHGVPHEIVDRQVLTSGHFNLYFELLDLLKKN